MLLNSFQVEKPEEEASSDGRGVVGARTLGNNLLIKNRTGNDPDCAFVSFLR